jgi:hypothetical protein
MHLRDLRPPKISEAKAFGREYVRAATIVQPFKAP